MAITKIQEGISGEQAAELIYQNDLEASELRDHVVGETYLRNQKAVGADGKLYRVRPTVASTTTAPPSADWQPITEAATQADVAKYAYTKDEYVPLVLVDKVAAPTIRINNVDVTEAGVKRDILKKLDQCFESIKTFNIPDKSYLAIRQFTYNKTTGAVSIGLSVLDDPTTEYNLDSWPVAFYSETIADLTKPFVLRFTQQYRPYVFFVALDLSPFLQYDAVTFNFRATGGLASFQSAGIKHSALFPLPVKSHIWGTGYDFRTDGAAAGAYSYPSAYYWHEAVKFVRATSSVKSLISVTGISYNAANNYLAVVIQTCDDDDPNNLSISTSRAGFAYLRINIPITDTGLKKYTSFVLSGSSTAQVEIVFDATQFFSNVTPERIANFSVAISRLTTVAQYIVSPQSSGGGGSVATALTLVEGESDFQEIGLRNFRFTPSTGNWVRADGYNMTKLIRIPEGTEKIDFGMSFDGGNSNALWMDEDGKALGWLTTTIASEVNNVTPPAGARFILASTLKSPATSRIVARGLFPQSDALKEYRTITEGLADKFGNTVFTVKGQLYSKESAGMHDVRGLRGTGGWLDSIPEFEKDGDFIIPTNVLHSDGVTTFSGGTLCAVKNGVMYFYNARACAVFKSVDWGQTYQVIFDKFSHPVWDTVDQQSEGRSTIHVLPDGEILFPVIQRGDIINPEVSATQRYRYYTLFRSIDGQTDIEKVFTYSYESTANRYWLPESDPQRNWPNHSGGCPLGDFTIQSYGDIVVATEYGAGTSEYWNTQVPPVPNNGRGVSGRAWVSFQGGRAGTWAKMFDADRKKIGTAEADDNWFYFKNTLGAKMRHMHGITLDPYNNKVLLTNGDGEDYVWMVDIEVLRTWYESAAMVDPDARPIYSTADTFPVWDAHNIIPSMTDVSVSTYSNMKFQQMQAVPLEWGWLWGHDAAREFAYVSYFANDGDFVMEPVRSFEYREDFDTDAAFSNSWVSTDGFVQQMSVHDGIIYMTHSNGGTRPSRIFGTRNGIDYKVVYEGANADIKFAGKFLMDQGKAFLSNGTNGQASATAGYWKLKKK